MIQLLDIQGTAKELMLLGPFERQVGRSLQALNCEIGGLAPGEDRLDNVGTETGERQKSADLCWIKPFSGGEGFERNDLAGDQLPHPFVRSRDHADEMLVSAWRVRMGREQDLHFDPAALDQQKVGQMEDRAEYRPVPADPSSSVQREAIPDVRTLRNASQISQSGRFGRSSSEVNTPCFSRHLSTPIDI
jgi:hypothetical protein